MYARQLHIPVLTEHVVVACCYRVGAFLINGRRQHLDWVTKDLFKIRWDRLPVNRWNLGGVDA